MYIRPYIVCLALCLVTLPALPARSAPRVQVRGQSTMRMLATEQRSRALVITGELLDRDLLTGLPYRYVTVSARVGDRRIRRRVRTDRWGRFRLSLPGNIRGTLTVSSSFAGDSYYSSQELAPSTLDVSKRALALELQLDRHLSVTAKTQAVTVIARAGGKAQSVPVALHDGRGRLLGRLTTGTDGRGTAAIPTSRLGDPGPITIQATFRGSLTINQARRRFEAVLVSPVTLELEAGQRSVRADGEISLTGRITDHSGPVGGAALGIFAMGERADTAISDGDGRFQIKVRADGFAAGKLDLQARYSPDVIWRLAARSRAVEVRVLSPSPISAELYLLPVIASALIILGLVVVHQRRRLVQLVSALRATSATEPPPSREPRELAESGLRLARPSIRSMITPAHTITGEVWDASDSLLIPGATIRLHPAEGAVVELRSGRSGKFETPRLHDGEYMVEVSRQGYVSERFNARLPHRGSLHGVRVDMVQVRVRILEVYRHTAAALLPREELWACWTPRELLHHLGRKTGRRVRPLELLTRLLEYCYWGTEPAGEEMLRQARLMAADAEAAIPEHYTDTQ